MAPYTIVYASHTRSHGEQTCSVNVSFYVYVRAKLRLFIYYINNNMTKKGKGLMAHNKEDLVKMINDLQNKIKVVRFQLPMFW